jgi:hypothetical protein
VSDETGGPENSRENYRVLDYATGGRPSRRVPLSGIASFGLMLATYPSAGIAFLVICISGIHPAPAGSIMFCAISFPIVSALIFGAYSLRVAGTALRNALGVVGLIGSGAIVGGALIEFVLGRLH